MFAALMDLAYHGLSLEPVSKATAYLTPRSHNIGTRDNKIWEQRVLLSISAYGELQLRMRSGIIKYADNPIMVYEGDIFEKVNGKLIIFKAYKRCYNTRLYSYKKNMMEHLSIRTSQ